MEEFLSYNILSFFSLGLVFLLFLHTNYYFKKGDKLLWKQVLSFVLLGQIFDILAWLVAVGSGPVFVSLSYIVNILLFTFSVIMTSKIALFLCYSIEGKSTVLKKLNRLFWGLTALNTVLLTLSVPFKFIFSIDANNVYSREKFYFITIAIVFLPLVMILAKLIAKYVKNYNKLFSDNKAIARLLIISVVGILLLIYLQGSIIKNITIVFPFVSLSILILHLILISKAITIDHLTKIQNKLGLELFVSQIPKLSNDYVVVIFFDLDNFKTINDSYGHKQGDKILIDFANILSNEIRKKDTIARIGGDEFIAVITTKNLKEVDYVVNAIEEEVKRYNTNLNYKIEYSIGIEINEPNEPLDKDELIEQADKKMYENKILKKQNTN